jgi:hypothetical protein
MANGISAAGVLGNLTAVNGGNVTVALSGLQGLSGFGRAQATSIFSQLANANSGILLPSILEPLSGLPASSQRGILTTLQGGSSVTGQAATGAVGVLGVNNAQLIAGVQVPPQTGTVSATNPANISLSGQAGTGVLGLLTPSLSLGIAGNFSSSSMGAILPQTSAILLGQGVVANQGNMVSARFRIKLAWTASVSPNVTGVYIGWDIVSHQASGVITGYANVVDVPVPIVNYDVVGLSSGVLYFLNATAHDANGHVSTESVLAGEVSGLASIELPGQFGAASVGVVKTDVQIVLSGVQSTSGRGNLSTVVIGGTTGLSGTAAAPAVGQPLAASTIGLIGVVSTSTQGSVFNTSNVQNVAGISVQASLGAMSPSVTLPMQNIGQGGNSVIGNLAFSLASDKFVSLSQVNANANVGIMGLTSDLSILGLSATGNIGVVGSTKSGSLALVGLATTGVKGDFVYLQAGGGGSADSHDEVVMFRRRR